MLYWLLGIGIGTVVGCVGFWIGQWYERNRIVEGLVNAGVVGLLVKEPEKPAPVSHLKPIPGGKDDE